MTALRFHALNATAWLSYQVGHKLYRLGLVLCGLGGIIDGKADEWE